jgi:hypothetical protein
MKTGDFINALVEDQGAKRRSFQFEFGVRIAAGLAFSLIVFFLFLGVRPDFLDVVTDPHVVFKFIFAASLFAALLPLAISALRPEVRLAPLLRWLALPLLVLAGGIAFQLLTSPPDFWISGMMGRYPAACLRSIPALAIGPLVVLLLMLRNGAPTHPVLSGALAGAASGGLAAFIYALHCPDDSALFVALWYSLAIGIMTAAGAMIGSRYLRW